jgi:hypothetical protein
MLEANNVITLIHFKKSKTQIVCVMTEKKKGVGREWGLERKNNM